MADLSVLQINLHKAKAASVKLVRRSQDVDRLIAVVTEPWWFSCWLKFGENV